MDHVLAIYVATRKFPKEESFGIIPQMRRAAVSIASNIAEGYGRIYNKETSKFLSNALGSATELETQLMISRDLGYIDIKEASTLLNQINEIIKMLSSLIRSLE